MDSRRPLTPLEPTYRRWSVAEAFTAEECARLRGTAGAYAPSGGQVDDDGEDRSGSRSSWGLQLVHGGDTDWVVDGMHPHVLELNRTLRFQISGYSAPQLLRYESGQQYAWHVDMGRDDLATRKISAIVLLSEADAYTGGDLEWMPDLGPCPRGVGTLLLFPSFMPHRVTPILAGSRFALVAWVHGDHAFR